jgi:hypothetical protein
MPILTRVHSGYHTHGVALDMRMVKLVVKDLSADGRTLTVVGPPNAQIYQPGVGFVYVLASGVPSVGQKVLIGNGAPPPSNAATTANMLQQTSFISRIAALAAGRVTNVTETVAQAWNPNKPRASGSDAPFQKSLTSAHAQSTSARAARSSTTDSRHPSHVIWPSPPFAPSDGRYPLRASVGTPLPCCTPLPHARHEVGNIASRC